MLRTLSSLTSRILCSTIILMAGIFTANNAMSAEPVQYLLRQLIIPPTLSDAHRAEIYDRAVSCLDQARSGADFSALASEYSEEPGAEHAGGDLGYFGYADMVAPFSDAVFSMYPGDIEGPVETQYGYHIIKLEDIRGDTRHARHILFMFEPNREDSLRIQARLEDARRELIAGADFGSVFARYPSDPMLEKTCGRMVWQRPEDMLPSFAEAVQGLGEGEISEPFASILGFHIVQVDSINYNPDQIRSGFPPDMVIK